MIKFSDSIRTLNPDLYLESKADEFWNILNPRKGDNELSVHSIQSRLQKLLEEYKNRENSVLEDTQQNQRELKYLEYLSENNSEKLESIIKSKPNELVNFIDEAYEILEESDLFTINNGILKSTEFGDILINRVFNYTTFRSSAKCIHFYKSLQLEGKQCFYCNDSELEIISKEIPTDENKHCNSDGKLLFDLDHFYLKSKYPFLALSFFNLIPCCGTCNSRFRSTKDFIISTHINPYLHSFDQHYVFEFDDAEIATSLNSSKSDLETIKLNIKRTSDRPQDKTAQDLELENRYRHKKKHINDILDTIIYYQDRGLDEIMEHLCGINEQHIPRCRSKILDVSKSKLSLDFLALTIPLLED
ncbi:hypothetical protein [Grimontia sp. SpTr1]|uniref:hypothetical protein n=1 Tax=Grimontia sp. SpTr1 TaxID=2995319 RepID=UPI00248D2965|nr:hypothetical protein [Grimontia sp. SpTr1]